MDFQEAEGRYTELKRRFDAGDISMDTFNTERRRLMVQDGEGRWWAKSKTGKWHYNNGSAWVPATPPGYQEATTREPTDSPTRTLSASYPESAKKGENGFQSGVPFKPVATLVGIMLGGIVLLVLVLAPFLRSEPETDMQNVLMSSVESDSMKSQQGESASGKVAFDAAFLHSATSANISGNSTYLDNTLTNSNPKALLYVTPAWNPGGSGSTYNEHPIGVWYDTNRQRWAIYNQDKAPMPDGAAFNVAVLAKPSEER